MTKENGKQPFDEKIRDFGRMLKMNKKIDTVKIEVEFVDGRTSSYNSYSDNSIKYKCKECRVRWRSQDAADECCGGPEEDL